MLVREAIANFGDARQAFVAFVETNWDHAELAEVPRLLDEVAGALRMLELAQPADYLAGVSRYTEVELIGRKRVPNGQQLDTLADALASLEYYLEALRDQRPNRDEILDITRQSLESPALLAAAGMRTSPRRWRRARRCTARRRAGQRPRTSNVRHDHARHGDDAAPNRLQRRRPQPSPKPPHPAAPRRPRPGTGRASAASRRRRRLRSDSDDIDDEIREVFLEEFDEEIDNLGDLLPVWREAPDDAERLRPIRRVFHTLKGSGRLVGAKTLGEFSWKIENLLNRVLDGTRPASPAVIAPGRPRLHSAAAAARRAARRRRDHGRPGRHGSASPTASPQVRRRSIRRAAAAPVVEVVPNRSMPPIAAAMSAT